MADAEFGAIHIDLYIYADTRYPVVNVKPAAKKTPYSGSAGDLYPQLINFLAITNFTTAQSIAALLMSVEFETISEEL